MVPPKFRIFSKEFGQNPRWPPIARYGSLNFFPMGDKFKILFSSIGFWGTGNALRPFTMLWSGILPGYHQNTRWPPIM